MLGSTHVVEQLLFFYVSFNSYFCFSLILEVFLMFWGTDELFLGWCRVCKQLRLLSLNPTTVLVVVVGVVVFVGL